MQSAVGVAVELIKAVGTETFRQEQAVASWSAERAASAGSAEPVAHETDGLGVYASCLLSWRRLAVLVDSVTYVVLVVLKLSVSVEITVPAAVGVLSNVSRCEQVFHLSPWLPTQ